jgi:transposase
MMTCNTPAAPVAHVGIGIDTARYGHRVNFLRDDRQPAAPAMTITENSQGFERLRNVLQQLHDKHPQAHLHVHLDAAGQYATNLERFLRSLELPITLSVGEPKRNKDYHKAFFPKQKTDDTESQAMARFAVVEQPHPTGEVPDECFALREIASRLQGQIKDTTRATNRLHNVMARVFPELATLVNDLTVNWLITLLKKYPTPQRIAAARLSSLQKIPFVKLKHAEKLQAAARTTVSSFQGEIAEELVIECVVQLEQFQKREKRLEKLLHQAYQALPDSGHVHIQSIPGIGPLTTAVLVAKIISIDRFDTADNLVGYFGIFPEEKTSGVDRWGNKIPPGTMRMSAKGSDLVRRYLWNAARSAIQHNAAVRDLYSRLRKRGTRGDVAMGHCMRKLLHQVFGVWTSNTPFDEKLARSRHTPTPPEASQSADTSTKTEKAAGHKRDVLPESKVVTAATDNVDPSISSVNQASDTSTSGSIDYAYLREQITMEQVLSHLGYLDRLRGAGVERRGPCPFHGATHQQSRSFSVNVAKHVFNCCHPECHAHGNALDVWAMAHQLTLYEAALHLAKTFNLQTTRNREEAARNQTQQYNQGQSNWRNQRKKGVITPDAT